jgi:APA family basic amino acid/polyamine antiporter
MEDLHMLVSIGTLFAFFLVSACVLILRYREPERPFRSINLVSLATVGLVFFGLYFNHTWPIMAVYIGSFIVLWAGFRLLGIHPAKPHQTFNCPGLPWLPLIGMGFNLYLMLTLPPSSWERLAIWMALGLIFYALYGFRKSKLGKQLNQP